MNKLLGPRIKSNNFPMGYKEKYSRRVMGSTWSYAIWQNMNESWTCGTTIDQPSVNFSDFHTLEAAIEYQDKILTEAGCIFLTEEQFDKLKVLL
jgi:hypothetical protein